MKQMGNTLKTKSQNCCFTVMKMTVKEDHIIAIAYELKENDQSGELLERMDSRYPFIFYFGNGKLLPAFEKHLYGLREDSSFDFVLTPDQAYGKSNALNIMKIPRADFLRASDIPEDYIQPNNMVRLTDDEGVIHTGKIISIEAGHIQVDFNILSIRKATIDEMVKGHYLESEDANWR